MREDALKQEQHEGWRKEKDGLFIEGILESYLVSMIIDTGSNISIVSRHTLQNLGVELSNVQPVKNCLRSVTGEKMALWGRIVLKLGIANQEIFQNFWVADIDEDCILGLDFLEQQGCYLDVTNRVMGIGDVRLPFLVRSRDDNKAELLCYRVVALEDVSVQPRTEVVIPARVINYSGGKRLWTC